MKVLSKILKIVLSIILTLAITLFIFANLATSTILNKNYVLSKFEETGYYTKIKDLIQSNFENYIGPSGFDEDVMENIVSDEKIKNDTKTIISNIYDGTNTTIDTTEIETNLTKNIEKSIGNTDLNITQQNAIKQYIEKICDSYKDTISHTNYEADIHQALNKVNKFIGLAKKVSIVSIIVLIAIIIVINYRNILRTISQIGISLTSSGALYIIINLFLNSKIKIDNIEIINIPISEVIIKVLTDILNSIMSYGSILLVCGILVILISNIFNNRKNNVK